jgi:hypothetical protein
MRELTQPILHIPPKCGALVYIFESKQDLTYALTVEDFTKASQARIVTPGDYPISYIEETASSPYALIKGRIPPGISVYVREYDTPQHHPDGFSYEAWAILEYDSVGSQGLEVYDKGTPRC